MAGGNHCGQCSALAAQLEFLRTRLGHMTAGLTAVVGLLEAENEQPTMPRNRLLAHVFDRLNSILER